MQDLHSMTYEQFNTYRLVAVPYILANAVHLNLSAGDSAALTNVDASYTTNEGFYDNPATRTPIIIHTRELLRPTEEGILRHIFNDVPKSAITPTDESTLHISANRALPSATPVMPTPPTVTIQGKGGGLYDVNFKNPATPTTKKFPLGQAFVIILQIITDAGVAPSATGPYTNVFFSSTNEYDLAYPSTLFGKQANLQCFYLNNRGQVSPSSVFQSFLIGQ